MHGSLEGQDAPPRAAEGAMEQPGPPGAQQQQQEHPHDSSSTCVRAAGSDQQTNGADTAATVISDAAHWLLTSLQLTSVQPACLPRPADPAAPVQHSLLLHLEAGLERRGWPEHSSSTAQPSAAESEAGAGTVVMAAGSVLDPPLPLPSAVLEVVVLAHNMQLLLQQQVSLAQLVQQQQQQQEPQSADVTSGCRSVCINISISFPAQPSHSSMDAVHLLLTVHEQSIAAIAAAADGARSSGSTSSSRLAVLVAEVPILLMSAAAQQEVQQLLLPAMRQDVQAGMAEQQQLLAREQATDDQLSREIMRVESTVWKHFCQLAQDMLVVVQLSAQAHAAAAAAAAGALAAASAGAKAASASTTVAVAAAAAAQQYSTSTAVVEASPGAAVETPPAVALQHLSENLVLPLLLPFLAAHGLYNVLQLLLDCLPLQLQQRWQQQQRARVQALAAADSAVERQHQQPSEVQEAASCCAGSSSSSSAVESFAVPANQEQQQEGKREQEGSKAAGSSRCQPEPTPAAAAAAASAAVAAAVDVTSWRLPLTGFGDGDIEQSYLAWKHHTLLHLDYLSAAFAVFYLVVLLRRMLREPTTVFYFLFIFIKALPHLPLVLGLRISFLRFDTCSCRAARTCPGSFPVTPWYRELWLLLVAPACVALLAGSLLATRLLHLAQPPVLLSTRAFQAYWQSHGELSTSVLRPFTMHMRLRPYAVYVAVDAGISMWAFGQVFGFAAAGARWGFAAAVSMALCWGLEFYMRRSFAAQLQQQRRRRQGGPAAAPGSGLRRLGWQPAGKDKAA